MTQKAVCCFFYYFAASQPSDTVGPLWPRHHHTARSQGTLFQYRSLIFSPVSREWLKNRHQTGLIKNRGRQKVSLLIVQLSLFSILMQDQCSLAQL